MKHSYPTRLILLLLTAGPAGAQAPLPTGNGVLGEYYDGANFEHLVARRRDATLAFDWHHAPPAPGVPAEYFSVRWTGWLVPPASGRYLLHATVDDGVRIWLNDRLVMDEWRPQPVRTFTTTLELTAGVPYKLRVDYYQDILDTSMRITWERPDVPLKPPATSWRNLWGMTADVPKPEHIPMRFLFADSPPPTVARPATPSAPRPPAGSSVTAPHTAPAAAGPRAVATRGTAARPRRAASQPINRVVEQAAPDLSVTAASIGPAEQPANSGSTARLARLAVGESMTLPDLFFEQGKARLLPATRAALDKVAAVLSARPDLHVEVQGHTDNVGNAELNRQLSQQRAETVCLYLSAHGVATAQLRPVGYGGSQPVADNADSAQRPRNRRVVLRRL
ncbi:MAG: PA14 domain-containing protein [Bacteroidota bacterium]|nr:PA14 domain-containing protein [Bacteroidota bacterium]